MKKVIFFMLLLLLMGCEQKGDGSRFYFEVCGEHSIIHSNFNCSKTQNGIAVISEDILNEFYEDEQYLNFFAQNVWMRN